MGSTIDLTRDESQQHFWIILVLRQMVLDAVLMPLLAPDQTFRCLYMDAALHPCEAGFREHKTVLIGRRLLDRISECLAEGWQESCIDR